MQSLMGTAQAKRLQPETRPASEESKTDQAPLAVQAVAQPANDKNSPVGAGSAENEVLALVQALIGMVAHTIGPQPQTRPASEEWKSDQTQPVTHAAKDENPPVATGAAENEALAVLQALMEIAGARSQTVATEAPKTPQLSVAMPTAAELPESGPEAPKPDSPPRLTLDLKDFDVRRFEFKTELEMAGGQLREIRVGPVAGFAGPWRSSPAQPKPGKDSADIIDPTTAAGSSVLAGKPEPALITAPEAVQRVQVQIDPPAPPPVVRQISMDIGEAESQVRVVIRERNGDLAVQVGAATEHLRENLQNAAPLLIHELRRDNPHTVSLDFSRFGTATEGGSEPHQDSRRKRQLKSEAVFADLAETAYLSDDTPSANSV